jgi:hypothetical protein
LRGTGVLIPETTKKPRGEAVVKAGKLFYRPKKVRDDIPQSK